MESNGLVIGEFVQLVAGLEWSGLFFALICFLALMFSAYIKISTVLAIVRSGFGLLGFPTVFVTTGLALALTFFVMSPTLERAARAADASSSAALENRSGRAVQSAVDQWRTFVQHQVHPAERQRFVDIAKQLDSEKGSVSTTGKVTVPVESGDSWRIIAPAFVVSELKEAFATGLSILLPLLIVDLLIANILVAVGLNQLDPVVVAFPFKLILFVMVDGWGLITANLVASYATG